MLFPLGKLLATPAVLRHLSQHKSSPVVLLARHANGDFGELCLEDIRQNQLAITHGDRILSAFEIGTAKVYVITEADRSCTTVLLASEY